MFFQKVVKGINGLTVNEARLIVLSEGMHCNWWRKVQQISETEVKDELTEINIFRHLNQYDDPLPLGHSKAHLGKTYGDVSPFISTTSGAIQRDSFYKRNILFSPFLTALQFATNNFKSSGYIFYAYLITIGKKAIALRQFSEEVRELHIYTQYLPFHHEGEIVAKISIPSAQIEKAEEYNGVEALSDFKNGVKPIPISQAIINPDYAKPHNYINIRELL